MSLMPRNIPKINGSSGAFIAVVVVLVVIIVVSCSAVAYLIMESRREGSDPHRRYQNTTSRGLENANSPVASHAPSGALRSTVKRFLSRHEKKNSGQIEVQNRRSGQGWVQAAGSDYEDSGDIISQAKRRVLGHAPQMSEILAVPRPPSTVPPSRESSPSPQQRYLDPDRERLSSMLSDTSMSTNHSWGTRFPEPDPYAPVPQRSLSIGTSYLPPPSMLSSPSSPLPPSRLTSSSPELMSGEDVPNKEPVYPSGIGRHFSTQSGLSMRTFDSGSKFIEAL